MPGTEPIGRLKISQLSTVAAPIPTISKLPVSIGGAVRVVSLGSLLNSVTGGTVTSISQGVNIQLSPNPITVSGTISFYLPGLVIAYAGSIAPDGWVFCDGSSKPIDGVYTDLFSKIGFTFGGSGSVFNLPDMRGRLVANGYAGGARGSSGGEENVFLTSTQVAMKPHLHTGSTGFCINSTYQGSCCDAGDHRVRLIGAKAWGQGGTYATWTTSGNVPQNGVIAASSSHNNMPPGLVMTFIIKL